MINSNEDRADIGDDVVSDFAANHFFRHPWQVHTDLVANREDIVNDLLAYIAHYCERHDMDPDFVFNEALHSYNEDIGDDPAFAQYPRVKVIE